MFKKDIYDYLIEDLDTLSFGFPKSRFRFDRGLVKKIFTTDQAQVFINMQQGYITPADYAAKNNCSSEKASELLEDMVAHGLIYRRHKDDGFIYRKYPFVMGFLEWQVHNPDKTWLTKTGLYMYTSKFPHRMAQQMPFYRTVPFNKEFVEGTKVMAYDDIEQLLDRHTRFSVAPCMCRHMQAVANPFFKCKHPLETCIETDEYATFFIETGIGREITKEETREILLSGLKDGRVINVTNSQDGENICSCCSCGCGILGLRRQFPGNAYDLWSNHYSNLDHPENCVQCGACVKRCPFDYIKLTKKGLVIDQDHCLGCGICVDACKKRSSETTPKRKRL
jgi:Dissimilatory sulfite reductase (desulfoviridin), alpha and beta subunits